MHLLCPVIGALWLAREHEAEAEKQAPPVLRIGSSGHNELPAAGIGTGLAAGLGPFPDSQHQTEKVGQDPSSVIRFDFVTKGANFGLMKNKIIDG